jgi:hypothetical protein
VATRKLIIAALITGMVILLAGAFQFVQIAHDRQHSPQSPPPVVTTAPPGR